MTFIEIMSVAELVEVFGRLDATYQSPEDSIAQFILANVKVLKTAAGKQTFMSNAMQAYAKLLQEHGVKV